MMDAFSRLTATVLAFFSLMQIGPPAPLHVVSADAGVDIDTHKVLRLDGEVGPNMLMRTIVTMTLTEHIPGPRIIVINSPGGYVDAGLEIIKRIEAEQAKGVPQVCVVEHAASMAFDILTHCDIRVAVPEATAMAHVVARVNIDCARTRCIPSWLREIA